MPGNDLALLTEAAHAAGDIARRYFNASPEVYEKPDKSPVTEADIAVDRMLRHELCTARPDYGWLSEETADTPDRLTREHVFIVDPIDGTRAFINGEPSFAHSLAVVRRGQVTAAAVYLPVYGKMYTASAEDVARLNSAPITVCETPDGVTSFLGTSRDMMPADWPGGMPAAKRHFRPSLAYRMCLIAEGRFDAMLTLRPCHEWDIAAGALIVARSDGTATNKLGAPLGFNAPDPRTDGLVAGGKDAHRDILKRLVG